MLTRKIKNRDVEILMNRGYIIKEVPKIDP